MTSTGFAVRPEQLDEWAELVLGLVDDAERAVGYVDRHVRAEGSSATGAYAEAGAGVTEARRALDGSVTHLRALLSGSGTELRRAAESYRSVDVAELARIDAALGDLAGASSGPITPERATAVPIGRRADPGGALVEPGAPDPTIPDLLNTVLSLSDWLSPSHLVNEFLVHACGVNPLEYVADQLVGDWASFARTAEACERLAEFDRAMAAALGGAADDVLPEAWSGEAADAAGAWFAGTADAVDAHAPALRSFARECATLSRIMNILASVIVDLLKFLIDQAIFAVITAVGASLPGPGWVAAAGSLTLAVLNAARVFLKIVKKVGDMYTAARAFTGGAGLIVQDLEALTLRPLPAGAYDHPGV